MKVLGCLLGIILFIAELVEFLAIPAIFVVVGILNGMPAGYYWITIGGYLAIYAALQLLLWCLEKRFGKHFDALLTNKIAKIIQRFEKK